MNEFDKAISVQDPKINVEEDLMLRPCPGPTGRCTPELGRKEEGLPRRVQDAG